MNELFAAIYTKLNTDLGAVSLYDHIPQNPPASDYPFVRLDPIKSNNADTDTKNGFVATFQVIGYSRYRGSKEVSDIADTVYNSLHHNAFADTATYGISGCFEEFREIITAPDGLTRNSVQRFTLIFEPLA